jgi:hypothetical protein
MTQVPVIQGKTHASLSDKPHSVRRHGESSVSRLQGQIRTEYLTVALYLVKSYCQVFGLHFSEL